MLDEHDKHDKLETTSVWKKVLIEFVPFPTYLSPFGPVIDSLTPEKQK